MNDIFLAHLHPALLLAEGTEELLHQSPVEEGTILVDVYALKVCEVAHHSLGLKGCGDEAFFIVEVQEYLYVVANLKVGRHIALGQEDLSVISLALKIHAEIYAPRCLQHILLT